MQHAYTGRHKCTTDELPYLNVSCCLVTIELVALSNQLFQLTPELNVHVLKPSNLSQSCLHPYHQMLHDGNSIRQDMPACVAKKNA